MTIELKTTTMLMHCVGNVKNGHYSNHRYHACVCSVWTIMTMVMMMMMKRLTMTMNMATTVVMMMMTISMVEVLRSSSCYCVLKMY
jgi:hypothetical protein